MRRFLSILAALGVVVSTAAIAAEPIATVRGFIDAFNKGDVKGAEATHAASVTIIDEVPPYYWQGSTAFAAWLADLGKHDAANGVTDGHMTLGKTVREETSADRAYVVVATEYTFKRKGVALREPSHMTFALAQQKDGWRIIGWTFAGPKPAP